MLSVSIPVKIRFSEVDSLRIVWHGHYYRYFEDGREAFGQKYGLGYMDVFDAGLLTPLVKTSCEHKQPIRYNDPVILETCYIPTEAAKIIFRFTLYNPENGSVYATGETVQVFLNKNRELLLTVPEFYQRWKENWKLVPCE